jgi:outer membrane protein assembly factor BamA
MNILIIKPVIKNLLFCVTLLFIAAKLLSQDNKLIINDIHISGNKTTRENIILRELTFHKGDTVFRSVLEEKIGRSRENLLNTSLFNYVTVSSFDTDSVHAGINILVEERWYTWPALILKYDDRNFSAWLKAKDLTKSKYGFSVEQHNCFGRRENLKLSFLFGYARQFSVSYRNIALDKNRKHLIGGDIELSRQDEVIYKTSDNEPLTYRNRFHSVLERKKYTINYLYRPYLNELHNFYLNFFEYHIADTLVKLNPDFLLRNTDNLKCFTLDYVFSIDKRDIKAYPLKGSYLEILIGQTVSVPFSNESFSSTVIIPSFYKYFIINRNLHYAAGINLKLSYNNTYSYLYSRSVGYIYNLHGFEYNTIEGQYFIILKNLLKFTVLKPRITEVHFIPIHKFNKIHYALYFNIFSDCGYVADKYNTPDNSYANKFLISGGAGFDFVTYYDRTIRAEYSVNGFGKSGFYIHLTAPINN